MRVPRVSEHEALWHASPVLVGIGEHAERQNRRCFAVEISPAYCDVVVERWETYTGKTAERLTA